MTLRAASSYHPPTRHRSNVATSAVAPRGRTEWSRAVIYDSFGPLEVLSCCKLLSEDPGSSVCRIHEEVFVGARVAECTNFTLTCWLAMLEAVGTRPGEIEPRHRRWKKCVTLLDQKAPYKEPPVARLVATA